MSDQPPFLPGDVVRRGDWYTTVLQVSRETRPVSGGQYSVSWCCELQGGQKMFDCRECEVIKKGGE
jgi:hypothetical protein